MPDEIAPMIEKYDGEEVVGAYGANELNNGLYDRTQRGGYRCAVLRDMRLRSGKRTPPVECFQQCDCIVIHRRFVEHGNSGIDLIG